MLKVQEMLDWESDKIQDKAWINAPFIFNHDIPLTASDTIRDIKRESKAHIKCPFEYHRYHLLTEKQVSFLRYHFAGCRNIWSRFELLEGSASNPDLCTDLDFLKNNQE